MMIKDPLNIISSRLLIPGISWGNTNTSRQSPFPAANLKMTPREMCLPLTQRYEYLTDSLVKQIGTLEVLEPSKKKEQMTQFMPSDLLDKAAEECPNDETQPLEEIPEGALSSSLSSLKIDNEEV